MSLTLWLLLSLLGCELKVIVEYPGETGLDTAEDTGGVSAADEVCATSSSPQAPEITDDHPALSASSRRGAPRPVAP